MTARARLIVLSSVVAAVLAAAVLMQGRSPDLLLLKGNLDELVAFNRANPVVAAGVFFGAYIIVTAISLPFGSALTLAGGAVFGFAEALLLVSFASSIGATAAFSVSRFFLRDAVLRQYGHKLAALNSGIEKDGAYFLFALRLTPIVPFFLINILSGVTALPIRTFYWVSQIGTLPATALFVNAGVQLAKIDTISGIISPRILMSMALIGVFPWIAKLAIARFRRV